MALKTDLNLGPQWYLECLSPAAFSHLGMAQRMEVVDGICRQRREGVWDSVNETVDMRIKDGQGEKQREERANG